ncbi:MAG: hypothetical protein ACI4WW_02745 [Candidatus Coprovivens sp.]
MKKFRNELLLLLQDNPELDVLFFADNDNICDDYSYTAYSNLYVEIEELTFYNDEVWLEYDDVEDRVRDNLADYPEFKDLSDEEFDCAVEEYIAKNYSFKKYICVWGS